jgi:cell division protein FtsB
LGEVPIAQSQVQEQLEIVEELKAIVGRHEASLRQLRRRNTKLEAQVTAHCVVPPPSSLIHILN